MTNTFDLATLKKLKRAAREAGTSDAAYYVFCPNEKIAAEWARTYGENEYFKIVVQRKLPQT